MNIFDETTAALTNQLLSLLTGSIQSTFETTVSTLTTGLLESLNNISLGSLLGIGKRGAKGEIADAFNALLNEALGHLTSIATSLANVGLATLVTSLQGKRGIFDGFADLWTQLTGSVGSTIDSLTSSLSQVGSDLLGAVTPHLQDLQDTLVSQGLTAAQSLLNTLAGISGTLQGREAKGEIADAFNSLLNEALGHLSSIATSLVNVGLAAVVGTLTGKREAKGEIADAFNSLLNEALGHLTSIASSLVNVSLATIVGSLQGKRGDIGDAFNALLVEATQHLTSIATSLVNVGLATLLTSLSGKRGLFDGFADLWNQLTGSVGSTIDSLTSSLSQVGSDLLGAVTPHLQDLQDTLVSQGLTAAQSLLNTLAGISGTLQG